MFVVDDNVINELKHCCRELYTDSHNTEHYMWGVRESEIADCPGCKKVVEKC